MEGQKAELKMIRMSEVESQEVKWLWYPFIPYGKLTIIQGDPGDGKTTLVLNIAAKLSKGECLDSDMDVQESVNVIYQTAEDGLADTVKPRLELAGADCEKILVIDESDKSLSMADERLEEALAKTRAKVLILDPIQAYLGGGMDMNRANEARDMTKKLGALAEKYQCAILLIGHMNKAYGKVCVDGKHFYSTKPENHNKNVIVGIRAHYIDVLEPNGDLRVRHMRQYGATRTDINDYSTSLEMLSKNIGAWSNSGFRKDAPQLIRDYIDSKPRSEQKSCIRLLNDLTKQYGYQAAVDAFEQAIRNNSVNRSDAAILAARIIGYGIDTPPEPGPSLEVYDQTFLNGMNKGEEAVRS